MEPNAMKRAVLLATLCLAFTGPVSAQDRSSPRASCTDDFKKFCQHVKPGKGAIKQCLLSQSDKISSACKTALEKTALEKTALDKTALEKS
jgi:cysteine rich repeat protein